MNVNARHIVKKYVYIYINFSLFYKYFTILIQSTQIKYNATRTIKINNLLIVKYLKYLKHQI